MPIKTTEIVKNHEFHNHISRSQAMSLFKDANLHQTNLTTSEVEIGFLKMVIARMALEGGKYLSENDKEAIKLMSEAHPQDIKEVDLEWLALDDWEELNPGYKYQE